MGPDEIIKDSGLPGGRNEKSDCSEFPRPVDLIFSEVLILECQGYMLWSSLGKIDNLF